MYCDSPDCNNTENLKELEDYHFCEVCRTNHSDSVLLIQVEHEKPIQDVILDSRIFKSANGMADYIGVSFVTLYTWIRKYFKNDEGEGMTFQEFRREHICRSKNCVLLDIRRSPYHRPDYIIRKIKNRGRCACINSLDNKYIMTNAAPGEMKSILSGNPTIEKISEGFFAIYPTIVQCVDRPILKVKLPKPVHIGRNVKCFKTSKHFMIN